MQQVAEFFDEAYRSTERYWWQSKDRYATSPDSYPYSLLTQMTLRSLSGQQPGRALDLGAGEGADAIRLARLGYQVDAVDISGIAAKKTRLFAGDASVEINVHETDASDFEFRSAYDVIICNGLLHYVYDKDTLIRRMQAATLPGGLNVVSLWSTFTPVPPEHTRVPVYCDDEDGTVTSLYRRWVTELLYFERGKIDLSHSDMPEHCHSHIKLIARKPKA